MFRNFSLKTHGIFILILLTAFFLRIVNISSNPPAMYGDELTMVLDVNSILRTGHDLTGKFLPLNFEMGGGRPVGYGYFSIPFVAMFGTSELGIRALSVLSGVGIVFLIYFLGKILISKKVGLFASAIMAVSPWDLSISRGGFETHFALFLALLMVILFLYAKKKYWFYIVGALCFGLSINTYSTYKLTLPLFLPFLYWFGDFKGELLDSKKRVYLFFTGVIFFLFALLLFSQALLNNSESRFLNQNILADEEIKKQITQSIIEIRGVLAQNDLFSRLTTNRVWQYSILIGRSYFNNFSVSFLFLDGDKDPLHNMAGMGSLYIVEIITIFLGIGYLSNKRYFRQLILLIIWVLLGPLPTSFIKDPHALRSSFMLPPLILFSGTGAFYLWNKRRLMISKILALVIVAGLLIQFIFMSENLFVTSQNKYDQFWAYPAKQASEIANQNKNKYDRIFLSDRIDAIEFAYPAYTMIDPAVIFKQKRAQVLIGEYKFIEYGNVYIGPIPDSAAERFLDSLSGSTLYIGPENDTKYLEDNYGVVLGKSKQRVLVTKVFKK